MCTLFSISSGRASVDYDLGLENFLGQLAKLLLLIDMFAIESINSTADLKSEP